MAIQLTIVGLGQIGTSIGLALANQENLLQRVGHDREPSIARKAEKLGALDRVEYNLPRAVRGADLVLLSLPADQIRDTMAVIASELKEGAVVMDTGPTKEAVATWMGEFLPAGRYYIGLTPVINPAYLHDTEAGLEAARSDLFHGGLMAIVSPPTTSSEAIKLAADLTRLLGAMPLFADPLEMDGLMASTHILPQLLAAALLNVTVDQPGWHEARKVAGRAYAEVTAPIVQFSDAQALRASVLLNRENVLRVLSSTIATLHAMRSEIEAQDGAALDERLARARNGRGKWWQERQTADWAGENLARPEIPEQPGIMGRLLGGLGPKPKTKK
jgi:prephenate dehydrogenase